MHHKVIGFPSFLVLPRPANRPIMKAVGSSETSVSANSVTYLHSPEERNSHEYESLNGKTEGIRQLGISQTGLNDIIKMDLKEVGCDSNRIHLAHDKDQWWALANRQNASQERLASLVHSVNQTESRGDACAVYDTVSL